MFFDFNNMNPLIQTLRVASSVSILMGFDCIILVIKHLLNKYIFLLQGGSLWENLTNSGDVEKIFFKILSLVKTAQGMCKVPGN